MCARDIGPPGFETRLSPPQPSTLGNRRPAHRQSPHFLAALGFSPRIKTKNYFVPPPSSPSLLLPSVESLSVECKSRSRPSEARWSSESLSSLSLLILSLAIFLVYIRLHASNSRSTPSARAAKMGSSSALRLAILECDTPQPQTRAQFGGYAGVFTALLSSAAKTLSPPQDLSKMVTITAHDVVNDLYCYPALEDVDALLLTGSRHTAFDNDPWILKLVDFTKRALETGRIRVVGICFGHQIVGRAVGAGVGKSDKGWEVAVTEVDLTDKGKEMFGLDKMRIHQMHRDIVQNFPRDAVPLGGNAFCPVQAMYLPGKYITVQGHPEFTNEIISEILFNRHTVGIFTDEVYEDAIKRAPVPHDGVAIGRAFLKFLREG